MTSVGMFFASDDVKPSEENKLMNRVVCGTNVTRCLIECTTDTRKQTMLRRGSAGVLWCDGFVLCCVAALILSWCEFDFASSSDWRFCCDRLWQTDTTSRGSGCGGSLVRWLLRCRRAITGQLPPCFSPVLWRL